MKSQRTRFLSVSTDRVSAISYSKGCTPLLDVRKSCIPLCCFSSLYIICQVFAFVTSLCILKGFFCTNLYIYRSALAACTSVFQLVLPILQEVISCQENLAADISDYYGEKTCEEVMRYLTVHRNLLSHHKTLVSCSDLRLMMVMVVIIGYLWHRISLEHLRAHAKVCGCAQSSHSRTHTHIHAFTNTHTHIHACTHMHTHTHTHTHTHIHSMHLTHACVPYTHPCTRAQTHAPTHTHTTNTCITSDDMAEKRG